MKKICVSASEHHVTYMPVSMLCFLVVYVIIPYVLGEIIKIPG